MDPDKCHGTCAEHGAQCAASIRKYDRDMVRRAGFSPGSMYNRTINHVHSCVQCLLDRIEEEKRHKARFVEGEHS